MYRGEPSALLQLQHARMHSGDELGLLQPQVGAHWAPCATSVTRGELSDGVWGSPMPQEQRVQAGWVQAGWVPALQGQDLLSQAVPSIHSVPPSPSVTHPCHTAGQWGGNRMGFSFSA